MTPIAEPGRLRAFIRRATVLAAPPLVPEVVAHLAAEIAPIWAMTEAELAAEGLPPPFWAFAWAGGQALARHVLDRPESVAGRRVLAFACGAGVEAVAAAKAGAAEVWASDLDPVALIAAELNAAANGVVLRTTAANLLDGPADGAPAAFDLILAGDAAYERPEADRLSRWLRAQVRAGAEALVGDAGRGFLDLAGWERIATYEVPTPRDLEDRPSRSAAVWRVRGD